MFKNIFRESALSINRDECTGCGTCVKMCSNRALTLRRKKGKLYAHLAHPQSCTECGKCIVLCKERAISLKEVGFKREAYW